MSCSIEVPRGAELQSALLDIQAHADDPNQVQAKFRTGSTPHRTGPTSRELAIFIRSFVDRDLSFKLTGGLHRATSYTASSGEDQFGFLNVIAATRWALAHGAEIPEMGFILSEHDPAPILDIITRMSEADASVVRAFFTSYGCCRVTDPISDLVALGLIKETEVRRQPGSTSRLTTLSGWPRCRTASFPLPIQTCDGSASGSATSSSTRCRR
jgi:hypothetical protein